MAVTGKDRDTGRVGFSARRSSGFTNGHVSYPHVVDVIERIRNRTRTQGRR
jgi:hypothetical protein